MSATIDSTGLTIDVFATALDEVITSLVAALNLTDAQEYRIRNDVRNAIALLARIEAEGRIATQEKLLEVYNTLSWYAEDAHLDRIVALLGVTRRAAQVSQVTGTASGVATTAIPDGTRLRYEPTGSTWATSGAAVIGGGGTVALTLVSESEAADVVALDPDSDSTRWTVLDSVPGWSDQDPDDPRFTSEAQPQVGAAQETDAELRARAGREAYARGQGPVAAIEAAVSGVDGVTYARAWENTGDDEDSDGVPGRAFYVVVEGGADSDIVAAIRGSRPGGIYMHGTDVVEVIDLGSGRYLTVRFDRVATLDVYVQVTLTTSTSEVTAPADVGDQAEALVLAAGSSLASIGGDILPWKLATGLDDLIGVDDVAIAVRTDPGDPWVTSKISVSLSQRPVYAAARISSVLA